jgi:diguanylate cyclase (GGDEF)-like protein
VRETDTVSRLGGDEFTVIISELDSRHSADRIAQKLIRSLAQPFQLDTEIAQISASIGITFFPDDATEMHALLNNADRAMYAAKHAGRNRYSHFTPGT